MLSKINFIGICLILITVIFGNKFAPGRYCAYYEKDTIAEFGPTLSDENGKFYNASIVGTFSDERAALKQEYPTDYRYVIINSWSNIIDKTVAGIAAVLLIVNVVFFMRRKFY
ncbi:MAG: hypothetical protein II956_09430 [Bacteroidales bacterium]|nr:hypothetical protein [Bacteroidales bacterium]